MHSGTLDSQGCPTVEPMNLGSPVGSPNNPGTYGSSQYLPSFLIGDPAGSPMNNSRLWNSPGTSQSPQRNRSVQSYAPVATTSPSKALFSPIPANTSLSRVYSHNNQSDKHGGPPIQGLYEYRHTPTTPSRAALMGGSASPPQYRNNAQIYASTANSPTNIEALMTRRTHFAPSPAQIDPFYSQGQFLTSEDHLDETWVTVFGFPPAAASYILQQFYHYGTIVEHKLPPSGNWMHIRYQTKLQAKIALSKNGKIFGNYMVGIMPCIDKNLIVHYVNKKAPANVESLNSMSILENGNQSPFSSGSEFSVANPGHVPQKRTGILIKARDFLFNW